MNAFDKQKAYENALSECAAVLEGEVDRIAIMATICCILRTNLPYYYWVGFYQVREGALIVGPYQGTLGCLHIDFGRGVCGTAAKEQRTILVEDVHRFPGHIACDARSQSEIVIPVKDPDGALIAVLDVDSATTASFNETDQRYLETLVKRHFADRPTDSRS